MRTAKGIVFDRDGTLIEYVPYLSEPKDIRLVSGIIEVLRLFMRVVISSFPVMQLEIKLKNLKILDLTGAGDLFAAGFLHGYVNKLSTKDSLKKGTEMSSKVIQQIGARL